jgi:hypothetical protein
MESLTSIEEFQMKVSIVDQDDKVQEITEREENKSPNYIEVYATGIEGGPFGPYDFRLNFYEESLDKNEDGKIILQKIYKAKVVVSYATAKQLAEWMKKHLDAYEKISGHKIYTSEKD